MTATGMQRGTDAPHPAAAYGANMVGVDLNTHYVVLALGAEIARH